MSDKKPTDTHEDNDIRDTAPDTIEETSDTAPDTVDETNITDSADKPSDTDIVDRPSDTDNNSDDRPHESIDDSIPWTFDPLEKGISLYMPSNYTKDTFEGFASSRKLHLNENNPKDVDWVKVVEGGWTFNTLDEQLVPSLYRGNWKQYLTDTDNKKITVDQGIHKDIQGKSISGKQAAWRALSHTGSGNLVKIPLYHSGFWVTLSPADESELTELYRAMHNDKIELGRYTFGALFSNTSLVTHKRIYELIESHIEESTINFENNEDSITDHILINDLPILMWGMACALNPDGHLYKRACSKNPSKCTAVHEGTLDLTKLIYIDDSNFSEWQRTTMAKKLSGSTPLSNVKRYQEELKVGNSKSITIEHGLDRKTIITLKVPSITTYFTNGELWISDLHETAIESLGKDSKYDARNNYIKDKSLASYLLQYGHYVESIDMGNNGVVDINEDSVHIEDIHQVLSVLSSNDDIRTKLTEGILDTINETTIAMIGIPNYKCSVCGGAQSERPTDLLPLDVTRVFFTLISVTLEMIRAREQ